MSEDYFSKDKKYVEVAYIRASRDLQKYAKVPHQPYQTQEHSNINPHLFEVHNCFLWIEPRKSTVSSPSTPWTNLTNRGC
jgi:hypothetical protein